MLYDINVIISEFNIESSCIEELTPVLQTFAKNGECIFYTVLDDEKQCSHSGNQILALGFKYCKIFQDYNDRNNNEVFRIMKWII